MGYFHILLIALYSRQRPCPCATHHR